MQHDHPESGLSRHDVIDRLNQTKADKAADDARQLDESVPNNDTARGRGLIHAHNDGGDGIADVDAQNRRNDQRGIVGNARLHKRCPEQQNGDRRMR